MTSLSCIQSGLISLRVRYGLEEGGCVTRLNRQNLWKVEQRCEAERGKELYDRPRILTKDRDEVTEGIERGRLAFDSACFPCFMIKGTRMDTLDWLAWRPSICVWPCAKPQYARGHVRSSNYARACIRGNQDGILCSLRRLCIVWQVVVEYVALDSSSNMLRFL